MEEISRFNPWILAALDAASARSGEGFADAMRQLVDAAGLTPDQETLLERKFVVAVAEKIGTHPAVADIAWLAQQLEDRTADFSGLTRFEIEFLLRGLAGSSSLLSQIPPHAAATVEIACLGVLRDVPSLHTEPVHS